MNRTLQIAFLSLAVVNAAALTGCKVSSCPDSAADGGSTATKSNCVQLEPLKKYVDEKARTSTTLLAAGKSVTIKNGNGTLTVTQSAATPDSVTLSAVGFDFEGQGDADRQKATDFLTGFADPTVTDDGAGNLVVDAPGTGNHGYDLTVTVPPTVGPVSIQQSNGELTLHGGSPVSTTVASDNGGITADGLVGFISLSTGNGDITLSATPSGASNVVHTDLGDINASIGAANLAITATTESGTVTFPAAWTNQTHSPDKASGTATIGDGAGTLTVSTKLGQIFFQ